MVKKAQKQKVITRLYRVNIPLSQAEYADKIHLDVPEILKEQFSKYISGEQKIREEAGVQ